MELQALPFGLTVCWTFSAFHTDDILGKEAQFTDALRALAEAGCQIRYGG